MGSNASKVRQENSTAFTLESFYHVIQMMMASSEICMYDPWNWNCSFHTWISASCVHKHLLKLMVCVPLWPGQEMQLLWAQVEGMLFIQRLAFALHGDCPYPSPILVLLDLGKQTLLLNILRYICSTKRNIPLNRISWYQCNKTSLADLMQLTTDGSQTCEC